jgi:hypothetical protein
LLVKDEPGVIRIRLGSSQAITRYSVPESVARRVHSELFEQPEQPRLHEAAQVGFELTTRWIETETARFAQGGGLIQMFFHLEVTR